LPPGATNYITTRGARRLREELANLQRAGGNADRVGELEDILKSVTIVEPPEAASDEIGFGSTVTIQTADGAVKAFTIVGVDELSFERDAVSWISPIGKALLAAEVGDRVAVGEQTLGKIVKVEYRNT
jgi:transcription elongation GreA/GreB family factor